MGVEYGDASLIEKIDLVDIKALKKSPVEFDNDTIRIQGKVFIEFENVALVNEGFSIWINSFEPAVGIKLGSKSDEELDGKNVEIIGIYKAGSAGHLGLHNGQISEIFLIKTK
tara:strand:- start:578 stop:916 length:339 start_codon:yes stop_codon:yes gene_type:complete